MRRIAAPYASTPTVNFAAHGCGVADTNPRLRQRRAEKNTALCVNFVNRAAVNFAPPVYSPAAASMIGTNFSAVRLAPPTSAPSTSAQLSSEAAFAPLTDPP